MVMIADSAVQLEPATIDELGIRVVEYPLFVNGEEYPVSMSMSREEKDRLRFILKDKANNVTTSGLREEDLEKVFSGAKGEKILFMHQSSRASTATATVLKNVIDRMEHLDITVFDTGHLTAAHSVQVLEAARAVRWGMDWEGLRRMLEKNRANTTHLGAVYDLFYLHRTGRIGLAKAVFGTALKIIPLLGSSDEPGVLRSIGKAKTFAQANQRFVSLIADDLSSKGSNSLKAVISVIGPHEEEARHLKDALDKAGWTSSVEIHYTNHSNMPHAGPDFYDIGYITL